MPVDSTTPSERISAAFESLTKSARAIHEASGKVASPVADLDRALQRLNVGVACWTRISGDNDGFGEYWSKDVGYARVGRTWGLAIRTVEGDESRPDQERSEEWLFNEAPHHLRIKAIEKLPELVEAMVEATNATAARLAEKVAPARELADAVTALLTSKKK
jgi:hypothetical protein